MSDKWDYRISKAKIAWEIAQKNLACSSVWGSDDDYFRHEVRKALVMAWQVVNEALPDCEEDPQGPQEVKVRKWSREYQ